MLRNYQRSLLRLCTWHTVCWVAVSFLIMRCFILPAARAEVFEGVGHHQTIDQVILWQPDLLGEILSDYNVQSRALYIGTECTAGLVDSLLMVFFFSVMLVYFFTKNFISVSRLKTFLMLAFAAVVSDLVASAVVMYTLISDRHVQPYFINTIQGLTFLKFAAYGSIVLGLSIVLLVHLMQVRGVVDQSVNNS